MLSLCPIATIIMTGAFCHIGVTLMSIRVERSAVSQLWPDKEMHLGPKAQTELVSAERKPQASQGEHEAESIPLDELEKAADHIGQALEVIDRGLEFTIHEDTNRVVVRVVNRETQEVIKEIPPEKLLDVIARIWEMIGLLVDERA